MKKRRYYLVVAKKNKHGNHFFGAFKKDKFGLLEAKEYIKQLQKQNIGEKYSIK